MLTQVPDFVDGYTYASMANEAKITRNLEPLYKADELEIFRLGLDPDLYPNVNWIDELLRKGSWSTRATLSRTVVVIQHDTMYQEAILTNKVCTK